MTSLTVGLSTCPNDTFLFHGLLEGLVDTPGLELEFVLADVQELNEALAAGSLDVGKASFAAALALRDRYGVLPVGSALGFGVGPVLLARHELAGAPRDVLAPGADTPAALLLRCLHPEWADVRHVRFDRIMPMLRAGEADAGVCIHEGRFTYHDEGLDLIEDLGASWEAQTGAPVPLGGLLARLDLGADLHARLIAALRDSLALARSEPDAALRTMRRHAQEMDDDVIRQHVELYVNDHTVELGDLGRSCLAELARRAGVDAPPTILG
ncbi:MAG: 1,4-dihydroxy-6-naphthoate synthase [Planctomycetota bacterium]